ncbi:LemA family protein [Candidatus Peregrinibacteria bacterium]|nr:LemA family protein [Candidatus Peregrinibacteria bacterium]
MELTPLFNLIVAAVILFLVACVYLVNLLKNWKIEIEKAAYLLYFEVTRRSDLIPRLIEVMNNDASYGPLIAARAKSMEMNSFGEEKKQAEINLWKMFDEQFKAAKVKADRTAGVQLSALEKDWKEANKKVESMSTQYNKVVGKYNRVAGSIVLKPLSLLVKAHKMPTF